LAKSSGKLFEEEIQVSAKEQRIWFFRVRDVNLPVEMRTKIKVPENPYDALIYRDGYLLPSEMKSTKGKSLPFKNIKEHQIDSLIDANTYDKKIIPGFLINFRDQGKSYFLHIDDLIKYQYFANKGEKECEGRKVNGSSISMDYCEGIATKLTGIQKRVKYRWYINKMIDSLIDKYKNN
jgi:penicillin-binding protein-related factor A (putative recombinase)